MNPSGSDRFNDGLRALEHERHAHEAFAASRRYSYDPRESALRRIDEYVVGRSGAPLVVWGPPGSGKSALVAYWAELHRGRQPGAFVVEHYVGTGVGEASHHGVVRHVLLEIKTRYEITANLPGMPDELDHALAAWLWYAQKEPIVLIIDGLNRLQEGGHHLRWLPSRLPPTIRLIVTTSQEEMADRLASQGWDRIDLEPLRLEERQRMVERFITEHPTELTPEQLRGVAIDAGSSNPLLLRMRLEEAHVALERDNVKETIERYLGARNLDELFDWKLRQLESEHGYSLVRDVTTLLRETRSGLSVEELARISGAPPEALERLLRGLEFYLLSLGGLYTFYYDDLREAIRRRYLSDPNDVRTLHLGLAAYFESAVDPDRWFTGAIPADPSTGQFRSRISRLAGELAHQLRCAGEWGRLKNVLAPIPILVLLYNGELRYELLSHWSQLGASYDIETVYRDSLDRYRSADPPGEELAHALGTLGTLLQNTGQWGFAEEVFREALEVAERAGELHLIAMANGSVGRIRAEKGDLREAMDFFEKQLAIAERLSDKRQIAVALGCMGNIHCSRGEYSRALDSYGAKLAIAEELCDRREIALALGSMGVVHAQKGDYQLALEYYGRQLAIGEEIGEKAQIAQAVGNMGNVYRVLGDQDNALECHKRKLAIAEEVGNKRQIAIAIGNVGMIHFHRGEYSSAQHYQMQKLAIAEELGDNGQIASALGNIGSIYYRLGDYANALDCFDRQLEIAREIGDRRQIVIVYGNIGLAYFDHGDVHNALNSHMKMLEIARELGDKAHIAAALVHIGRIYTQQRYYSQALSTFDEVLEGSEALGNKYRLSECLYSKAALLIRMVKVPAQEDGVSSSPIEDAGRLLAEARRLVERCVDISEEISHIDILFDANVLLARIRFESGDREQAIQQLMSMFDQADDERMQGMLKYELATIWHELGSLDDARRYAREALVLFRSIYERMPAPDYAECIATLEQVLDN